MQKFTLIGILGDKSMADIQGWRSILDAYYDEKKTNRWISEWFGFAVESVAAFAWNGWQASSVISSNLGLEYAILTRSRCSGRSNTARRGLQRALHR